MMNTDVMRQLVAEAELGDRSMPTAVRGVRLWNGDPTSLVDIWYSANAIYRFTQNATPVFLRLSWAEDRQQAEIEAELEVILTLHCTKVY
ncbi:MAG: hypothetical protein P1S60_09580 [Anaerolineae bacterium]|nr:hypothetical protein [Anaerolineae bacterium]